MITALIDMNHALAGLMEEQSLALASEHHPDTLPDTLGVIAARRAQLGVDMSQLHACLSAVDLEPEEKHNLSLAVTELCRCAIIHCKVVQQCLESRPRLESARKAAAEDFEQGFRTQVRP